MPLFSRSRSGEAAGTSRPPPPSPGMEQVHVKVPQGMAPGQEIQFPNPRGRMFKARIPPGVVFVDLDRGEARYPDEGFDDLELPPKLPAVASQKANQNRRFAVRLIDKIYEWYV